MNQSLHYNQITSIPRKCVVESRSECDTSIDFCGYKFTLPVVPANMSSVVNEDICKWLAFNNYFYIYHRFGDTRKFLQRARAEAWPMVSISVGVQEGDKELIKDISDSKCRVNFVTIDIAHGFSDSVADMIKFIKENLPETKVIAGNIWGDKESVEFLQSVGADCLKIGLSCGAGCTTFSTTSFGSPMFSTALEAGKWAKIPVILDGGVREPGDIARALIGFMANQGEYAYGGAAYKIYNQNLNIPMVMIGSLFAACIDAPGENIYSKIKMDDALYQCFLEERAKVLGHPPLTKEEKLKMTITHKRYYGSASAENKQKTGQEIKHVEGKSVDIPCNGKAYEEYYKTLIQAVKSQISYAGGKDLSAFKDVRYRILSV
jgi:GMP reductase